jgi:hypothetical protein
MTYSEKAKNSTYKWRESNHEHYNELQREYSKRVYEKTRDTKKQKVLERYYIKKDLNSLLDIMMH